MIDLYSSPETDAAAERECEPGLVDADLCRRFEKENQLLKASNAEWYRVNNKIYAEYRVYRERYSFIFTSLISCVENLLSANSEKYDEAMALYKEFLKQLEAMKMFDICQRCGRSIYAVNSGLKMIDGKMCVTRIPSVYEIRPTDIAFACDECVEEHRKELELRKEN